MRAEELIRLAEETGFDHVGTLNMSALVFRPEVRDMCAADKCSHYGRNWCCPPGCGTLEEMAEKVKGYGSGILVQTTAELEDDFDIETMMTSAEEHGKRFMALHDRLCELGIRNLCMGTGACTLCRTCVYPEAPCRFPERAMPSMEACGLVVSQVCADSGMAYYYGKGTLTYTACVLAGED